ncbi:glycoside hydrolase family 43 protein [Cystobacter fuscus]|uniref:glycoside hydrolase family 43 protein n=1 Tax=Cystobacter fuscus TaxID=43 RepID=UPI001B7F95A7|nr:glycoside hydrolase family 43 protein [Cystobacter fuscus]
MRWCLTWLTAAPLALALLVAIGLSPRAEAAESFTGYLMVHFIGEGPEGEQIYFSHSRDGLRWRDLNGGRPTLLTTIGTRGVRDPTLVRSPAGDRYWIVATDLCIGCGTSWGQSIDNGSRNLVVWESTDLINWSAPRLLNVASAISDARNAWAPEAIWNPATNDYVLYWASNVPVNGRTKHRIFYARTSDFRTLTQPQAYITPPGTDEIIDTQIIATPTSPNGYRYYRSSATAGQITVDASNDILSGWTNLGNLSRAGYSNGATPGTIVVEGPMWAQSNDGSGWNLWLDQFATGRGYTPVATNAPGNLGSYWGRSAGEIDLGATTKRHGFIMNLTAAEESRILAQWGSATISRLRSYNFSDRYIRHAALQGRVDANVQPSEDAQFRVRTGWVGGSDSVSFESVNFPGYYLRHSAFEIVLARYDGSAQFRADASFTRVAGLADASASSFRSVNFPERYLRHYNQKLRIDPIDSNLAAADATYRVVP